jgi:chemotaxis protein methyltransferase CheR
MLNPQQQQTGRDPRGAHESETIRPRGRQGVASGDIAPLSALDFETVRELAHSSCGLNLHEGKKALVSSRLERLVRRHGFGSFTDYIRFVSQRRQGDAFTEFIDTLTTNHSGFWREPEHFIFLQESVFPTHRNRIRIWSAACATGEEPYTIAMCALESNLQNCTINASDISRGALATAMRGEYDEGKTGCLPMGWKDRYFRSGPDLAPGLRAVTPQVRALVGFAPVNLLEPFDHVGNFDLIFCRNVMIYFDQPTRDHLVDGLMARLTPGGYLLTGHSETLIRLPRGLEYVQAATYRKVL